MTGGWPRRRPRSKGHITTKGNRLRYVRMTRPLRDACAEPRSEAAAACAGTHEAPSPTGQYYRWV